MDVLCCLHRNITHIDISYRVVEEVVVVVLQACCKLENLCAEEVLRTCNRSYTVGLTIGVRVFARTIVALAICSLSRCEYAIAVAGILRCALERETSAVDKVVGSLGNQSLVWREIKTVASTTVLVGYVVVERDFAVCAGLDVCLSTDGLRLDGRNLDKAVAIVVVCTTNTTLAIECKARLAVVGYERGVQSCIVIECAGQTNRSE